MPWYEALLILLHSSQIEIRQTASKPIIRLNYVRVTASHCESSYRLEATIILR